jgi:hypothetical protein
MKVAVFVTIWAAMALFVAGEAGKRRAVRTGVEPRWAWPAWTSGAVLCAAHVVSAFGAVHLWSHDAALRTTAAQTEAVYGFAFGRGIYVSYAFVAIWLAEALWWKLQPESYFRRPRGATAALRAFYLLIIVNGAVVFTAPSRQLAGAAVVLLLAWLWRDTFTAPGPSRWAAAPGSSATPRRYRSASS